MAAFAVGPMSLSLLMMLLMGGGPGLPLGIPPGPEDPLLSKVAPEECLFYTSWAGAVKPNPSSPNQTEQLLAEPEVQQFVSAVEQQIRKSLSQAAEREGPEAGPLLADLPDYVIALLTHPAALFVSKVTIVPGGPPEVEAAGLVNLGDEAARLKASLEKHQATFLPGRVEQVEIAGSTWYRIKPDPQAPEFYWGVKGKYLIASVGRAALEGVLRRAGSEAPQWLVDARKELPVPRPATFSYLNVKKVLATVGPLAPPEAMTAADALGLGNVEYLAGVTGLDETGFMSRTLVRLSGPPQGVLQLISDQPLAAADLAAIPADSTLAVALKLDADQVLETILSIAGKIEPRAQAEMTREIQQMEQALGINLRDDVLKALGDNWSVYSSPTQSGFVPLGVTAVVGVKDRQRLASAMDKIMAFVKGQMAREEGLRRGPTIDEYDFEGKKIYIFNARESEFPLAPSWCLDDGQFVVALFPQSIKAHLARAGQYKPLAEQPEVAAVLQSANKPVMLSYVDTRTVFELVYPFVPMIGQAVLSQVAREGVDLSVAIVPSAAAIESHLRPSVGTLQRTSAGIEVTSRQTLPGGNLGASAPVAVALLLPAVQSAREAARRAQSMNNLKQIALAMHNYADTHGGFPPAYVADKDGKPLLSWRVLILPYLEQQALYEQFRLDEPWDSEHNKKLSETAIAVYHDPNGPPTPWMTNYLTVRGEDTAFPGKEGIKFAQITDGTSNTIMLVEVNNSQAVPWAKPADFEPNQQNPLAGLVGLRPGGFLAAFCDGSVRFISATTDPQVLKAMFTRNGGEVTAPGSTPGALAPR